MKYFPEIHQLELNKKNPSYINSLFVGVVTPIMHLPRLTLLLIISPLIAGIFKLAQVLFFIPYHGLRGRANANDLSLDEAYSKMMQTKLDLGID